MEVRAIYDRLRAEGQKLIALVGDFNKGPEAGPPPEHPTLEALFDPAGGLVDAYGLEVFDVGTRPGTFEACSLANRLDYTLLSPEFAALVSAGGINRKGLWGNPKNKNPPTNWDVFPPITSVHAASDHAAVWIDFDL